MLPAVSVTPHQVTQLTTPGTSSTHNVSNSKIITITLTH